MKYVRNQWDRLGAWACIVAGCIALLVGYEGVSGTLDTGEQIPYVVSGGLAGLFLLGLGAMLWLSADLRDEWRKLDAIDRHLGNSSPLPPPAAVEKAAAAAESTASPETPTPQEISLRPASRRNGG